MSGKQEQRLFVQMMLHDIIIIDKILSKEPIEKCEINEKYVWTHKSKRRSLIN